MPARVVEAHKEGVEEEDHLVRHIYPGQCRCSDHSKQEEGGSIDQVILEVVILNSARDLLQGGLSLKNRVALVTVDRGIVFQHRFAIFTVICISLLPRQIAERECLGDGAGHLLLLDVFCDLHSTGVEEHQGEKEGHDGAE